MTVCIAGICSWGPGAGQTAIAICDRMITTADLQFEPDQPKMFFLNARVGALIAGSGSAQTSICTAVQKRVAELGDWDDASVSVQDVADLFAQELAAYRLRHAEQIYLRPLGIDAVSFMANQTTYAPQFVQDTIASIQNYDIGDMQTIIMGADQKGPRLFHIDKWGNIRCDDLTAFSAIGIGEWHATSHLMLAKYSKNTTFQSALLQIYLAKRKAEAAPGIGRTTDIFFISEDGISTLRSGVQDILKACVDEMEARIAPLTEEAEISFRTQVDAFLEAANQTPSEIERTKSQIEDSVDANDTMPKVTESNDAEEPTEAKN